MKKETKKKIINTSLITTLGIGAMTPIAIALSKNAEANSELNNNIKQSRGISNFTGDLNSSSQFYIADSGNMPDGVKNIKIESFSPNDYRPVPQGFVFRGLGNNGKYYLTCVSKDDPRQVVWYDDYDQMDILQVEYIPREDKLVVLYSTSKKASGTGTEIRIGSYSNASSLTGDAASKLTRLSLSPPQLSGNQRVDMFAFSPVVKVNSTTDEVFVYSKTYNGSSASLKNFMGLYNIKNNTFWQFDDSNCGPFPFYYNNAKRYVLSVGVARKNTGTYVFSLLSLIRSSDNGQYDIALEMHNLYYNSNSKKWIWEGGDGASIQKLEWFTYVPGMPRSNIGRYSDSETMEIVRGSISIPSIWSNRTSSNDGQKIAFAHFANTLVPVGGDIHRTPIIAQHVIDMDAWSASARKVGLFDAAVAPGRSAELWNGFALNQTLYAKGYGEYKYTHGSTPFVGMGWKDSVGGLQGGAGIIIKDPTNDTGGLDITSSSNDTAYSRVFAFDQNHGSANISNTQFYSSIWKDTGNQWSSEQQNMGILIPEYYSNEESNPFDINLYGLQNGSRSLEIIDSSGRGAAITNTAKYGYNTVYIDSSERRIDANEPSKRVSTVTADYLNTKYNLNDNSIPSWQNQIIPSLNIRNLRDDTKINFDNRSNKITYNYNKGEVTVDVYGTALYSNGELKYTDDVAKLRKNWWPEYKIGSVTFFGFKPQLPTTIKNSTQSFTDNSFGSIYATKYSQDQIQAFINTKKDEIYNDLPADATLSVDQIISNIQAGTITFKVKTDKWFDNKGVEQTSNTPDSLIVSVTLTGFKTTNLTTTINAGELIGVNTIIPSELQANDATVKQALINSGFIVDTAYGGAISSDDIEFTVSNPNNIDGSVQLTITIKHNKAWVNGSVQDKIFDPVVFTGFKPVKPTSLILNNKNDNTLNTKHAFQFTNSDAQEYIFNNKDEFFNNLPISFTKENIVIKSIVPTNKEGKAVITLTLNKFINDQGLTTTSSESQQYTITLTGFNTQNLTTEAQNGQLTGVDTIFASDIQDNDARVQKAIFDNKDQLIKYLMPGKVLEQGDVSFVVVPSSADNSTGQLQVTITINNSKAWNDGVEQALFELQPITLGGFARRTETTKGSILSFVPTDKGDQEYSNKYSDDLITKLINEHKNEIYNSLPSDATLTFENRTNNVANGTITFNVKTNKWFNAKGVVDTNVPSNLTFEVQLTGFYNEHTTTVIPKENELPNLSNILATDYQTFNETILNRIKKEIAKCVQFTDRGDKKVELADIELTITDANNNVDSGTGYIIANVNVINNKAWENGVTKPSMSFNGIKFTGFKVQKATKQIWNGMDQQAPSSKVYAFQFNEAEFKKYVLGHENELFESLPNNLNESNIVSITLTPNNKLGTVEARFKLNAYFNDKGIMTNAETQEYTINFVGFNTQNLTTSIKSNPLTIDLPNKKPSDILADDQDVKTKLIEQIINCVPDQIIEANDLTFTIIQGSANNLTGEIKVSVTINNSKAWNDGNIQTSMLLGEVTLNGLQKTIPTSPIKNAFDNVSPSEWIGDYNDEKVTKFVENKMNEIYQSLPENTTITTSNIQRNYVNGQISAIVTINKWFDDKGNEQTGQSPLNLQVSLILTGFDLLKNTTSIDSNITISGLDQLSASDWNTKEAEIKAEIIKHITNASCNNDGTLNIIDASDITLSSSSINNRNGEVELNVVINNDKAWQNGTIQPITLSTTISGFKPISPTELKIKETTVANAKVTAQQFVEKNVKKYIFDKKDTLFSSLPSNLTEANINIVNLSPDNKLGTIKVEFTLGTWYDQNGNLQTSPSTSFNLTLNGFIDVVSNQSNKFENDPIQLQIPSNESDFQSWLLDQLNNPNSELNQKVINDLNVPSEAYDKTCFKWEMDPTTNQPVIIFTPKAYVKDGILVSNKDKSWSAKINDMVELSNPISDSDDKNDYVKWIVLACLVASGIGIFLLVFLLFKKMGNNKK